MGRDSVDVKNSKSEVVEELISNVKMIEAKLEELIRVDDLNDIEKDKSKSDSNNKAKTNVEQIEAKLKELIELNDEEEEKELKTKLLEYTSELKLADLDKEIMTNIEIIEARLRELTELDDDVEKENSKLDEKNENIDEEKIIDIEQENVEKISIAVVIGIVVVCSIVGSVIGYLLYKIAISNSDAMAMIFRYFV